MKLLPRRLLYWCHKLTNTSPRRLLLLLLLVTVPVVVGLNYAFHDKLVTFRSYLRPLWPHGYQTATPDTGDAELLNKIYSHMNRVKPPVFQYRGGAPPDGKIPKLVHLSWKDEEIPQKMAKWVEKWRTINPDWTVLFWTDATMAQFTRTYYPKLVSVYESLPIAVEHSDLFRYTLLLSFGGVWADLDVEPLKHLDPIRDWASFIVSEEPPVHHQVLNYAAHGSSRERNYTLVCNAFMASKPGHPFLFFLISEVTARSPIVSGKSCDLVRALGCTGPDMVTFTYVFYKKSMAQRKGVTSFDNDVMLTSNEWFLPTFDDSELVVPNIKKQCQPPYEKKIGKKGRNLCLELKSRDFKNKPIPKKSFTNHWWFHTYFMDQQYTTVGIKYLLPKVVFFYDSVSEFKRIDRWQ